MSIIVPVLNEERAIGAAIRRLDGARQRGAEVIVVDGGSTDATVQRALDEGAQCLRASTGRAIQMNTGAEVARGRLFAFMHADTIASERVLDRLIGLAGSDTPGWGWFDVRIDDDGRLFRTIGAAMNLRSRLTRVATGDQLIFVHRVLFREVGGYPPIALMEDVALSKALRRRAAARCCRETVLVSARRWRREGPIKTMLLMWWLRLRYLLGADPLKLARSYRAVDTDGGLPRR